MSVMSALSIATSDPVPIVIPTFAWASDDMSGCLELPDFFDFLVGQNLGLNSVNTELACDCFGGSPAIAGQHYDSEPYLVEALN